MIYYSRYYDLEGNFLWEGEGQPLWVVNATFNREGKRYRVRNVAVAKYLAPGMADNIQIVNIIETDPEDRSRLNTLLTKAIVASLTLMEDEEVTELRGLLNAAETDDKLRVILTKLYICIVDHEITRRAD